MQALLEVDRPYLASDIPAELVQAALGPDNSSIWTSSSAGCLFELQENARIDGCLPGTFPIIDSVGDTSSHLGVKCKGAISLKTIDMNSPKFNDADAWQQFHSVIQGHQNELMQFRAEKRNLVDVSTGKTKEVAVSLDDVQVLELRVGIQKSVFDKYRTQFWVAQLCQSDGTLGGESQIKARVLATGREVPVITKIKPIPDNFYQPNSGHNYEKVKAANIFGADPAQFKAIDKYVDKPNPDDKFQKRIRRVISYKSHDILNHYKDQYSFGGVLVKDINALAEFNGYTEPNGLTRTISSTDFDEKRLSIAIPMINKSQLDEVHNTFMKCYDYAQSKGVKLRVHRVS